MEQAVKQIDDLLVRRRTVGWSLAAGLDAPFLAPLRAHAMLGDLDHFPTVDDLNERLRAPVRFVLPPPKRERARTRLYEYRAAMDGEVLTRPHNWHDLMNALVWGIFPQTKITLSRLLVAAQEEWLAAEANTTRDKLPGARLRVQDLLALFDEGGVVRTPARDVWFGHALYEHRWLVPQQPLRGSLLLLPDHEAGASIDHAIAEAIAAPAFLTQRQPTAAI